MSQASETKHEVSTVETPPTSIGGILLRLGPGLIVAGSIVGSGELIATTATGAQAGFWLLWLIVIGCVIKVFAQVELGRYTIITGNTTMHGMNEVPGPRLGDRGNWLVWFWFLMFLASLGQLGGIVGGVGQALAISAPLTQVGREYNEYAKIATQLAVKQAELKLAKERLGSSGSDSFEIQSFRGEVAALAESRGQLKESLRSRGKVEPDEKSPEGEKVIAPSDDKVWAAIITTITALLLMVGRYGLIQSFSTALVASFTLITIVNLFMLQSNPTWGVSMQDIINGMSFRLNAPGASSSEAQLALGTALATFGIIGVGASELVTYPYWCLEKGYARFTGPRDGSSQWADRAKGWMHVMHWDAWCSMVIYTFATIAFYLLGAAILGRTGLDPKGSEMIRVLSVMYEPVFGRIAQVVFLFGSFAVLYSTFFVANASHARVFSDALRVLKFMPASEEVRRKAIVVLGGLFPFVCLLFYVVIGKPQKLVLISGLMQAVMLPMLSFAALFFRYRRCDERLKPGLPWDICLWLSAVGMLIAGGWAAYAKGSELLAILSSLLSQ